jgi:hypothetical protein
VTQAEPLRSIAVHQEVLTSMARQVTDCGYFIRDYAEDKGFCEAILFALPNDLAEDILGTRVAKHSMSNADYHIDVYLKKFRDLERAFQLEASREVNIIALRVLDDLQSMDAKVEIHCA